IGAGLGIAINAAMRLTAGEIPMPTWPALVAAAFSIGANEWLFRVQVHIGRKYQASTVIANAWHHRTEDFRIDDVDLTEIPVIESVLEAHDWDDVRREHEDFD
ncbi:MAG: hypothetical protein ABEK42_09825, partial [Thiohalorhabdaceae bacterium]